MEAGVTSSAGPYTGVRRVTTRLLGAGDAWDRSRVQRLVPGLITAEHIRPGAVLVDVGITRGADGKLHGDFAPSVWDKAAWVTPVPGGVGPMTIAVLLSNTVRAFRRRVEGGGDAKASRPEPNAPASRKPALSPTRGSCGWRR